MINVEVEAVTDDHPLQQQDSLMAELVPVLQSTADTQHNDEQDAVVEEGEAVIEDHPPQQNDSLVTDLVPPLSSQSNTHVMMEDDPSQHQEDTVIEEAEAAIDDQQSHQQNDSLAAELLPLLQSIADTHSVMTENEAPFVQTKTSDEPPLPQQKYQVAQEQQLQDEIKYSLQELVSNQYLTEFWDSIHLISQFAHSDEATAFGGASDSYNSLEGSTNLGWPSLKRRSPK